MPTGPTGLHVRMVAALLGLAAVTVGFLGGIWAFFYVLFVAFGNASPPLMASLITVGTVLPIGYLEYRQLETIERLADAQPVDRESAPEPYETTTRVASQLGVPVPTIAVSERDAPEALVVGYRPSSVHLVLSLGTLEALDGDELEAVIAHELAHVKNRDAMVMTAVSLPVVLADGLRSRIDEIEEPGWTAIVLVPLSFLATVAWVAGRTVVARLSRGRELAADRAAAAVTGSPAALAGALRRLDREVAETPTRDLRAASGVSSLSIVSLEPSEPEKIMLGPEGETEPSHWWLRKRLHRLEHWLFDTHPPTTDRVESLAALERES